MGLGDWFGAGVYDILLLQPGVGDSWTNPELLLSHYIVNKRRLTFLPYSFFTLLALLVWTWWTRAKKKAEARLGQRVAEKGAKPSGFYDNINFYTPVCCLCYQEWL